jgi:phenylpropionate dioxygenase-like ring-hydroxylating dioxygenase large terminal subunit
MLKFIILFINIKLSWQLNINLFNHWTCVGIIDKIDFTKPYVINIGDLPLVIWKNNKNIYSSINICKHMGSKLDNGIITDKGCLKCRYHGFEYNDKDTFGKIIEQEGKLFWSYDPIVKTPFKLPYYNNNNYDKSFIEIDMDCSLTDSIYNTMDLRHPEYVHNKIVGFGNSIPPTNIKHYKYNDRIGLSFDYTSNQMTQTITRNTKVTNNFHMFVFPTFSWSKVIFDKDKHLIIGINLLPISPTKTKWYVTVCSNHYKSFLEKHLLTYAANIILLQDFIQMKNQYPENSLKKEVLFNHVFVDEEVIIHLKDIMNEYKYIDIEECTKLYKKHKNNK